MSLSFTRRLRGAWSTRVSVLSGSIALAACLTVSASAWQRPDAAKQGAVIQGTVVDALTGRPLRGALVRFDTIEPRTIITTRLSDANGRFEIGQVSAGRYDAWARLAGYVGGGYQQRSALAPRALLDVPERGVVAVTLRLWGLGVISGQVLDDAGEPAVGVTVMALSENWSYEAARFTQASHEVVTDDRGSYRLSDIEPGTYIVGIAGDGTFHTEGRYTAFVADHPTTYAPGVLQAEQGERIQIDPAEERHGVNIRIPATDPRVKQLRGRLVDGPLAAPWIVELLPQLPPSFATSDLDIRRTGLTDGRFEFDTVRPGAYVLRAIAVTEFANMFMVGRAQMFTPYPPDPDRSIETKPTWWAETMLMVNADTSEPGEISLRAQRGLQIRGRLRWDGASPPPGVPSVIKTQITVSPTSGRVLINSAGRPVDSVGRFETIGLPPGRYALQVGLDPANGWSVKSIGVGGRIVPDGVIELASEDVSDVVVSLTDRRSEISGIVRSSDGKPVPDCAVFVFPTSRSLWTAYAVTPRRVVQVHPNGDARYSVRGLPVDDYYVVATNGDVPDHWQNPTYLATLVPAALKAQIGEGSRVALDLKVERRK